MSKSLQAVIGLIVMAGIAFFIFRVVVPKMQNSLDSPEIDKTIFIDTEGAVTDSVCSDSVYLAEKAFVAKVNTDNALLLQFQKLIADQVHSYAITMNLENYKNLKISNISCTGYSESHFIVSYTCDYMSDRIRYAYLYQLSDSSYIAVVGATDEKNKDFSYLFGASHFLKGKAEVQLPMKRYGRRSTFALYTQVIDDIGRVVNTDMMYNSVCDDGELVAYSETEGWVLLGDSLRIVSRFPKEINFMGGFHDGLAKARKGTTAPGLFSPDDRWGYIDQQGKWVIEPQYGIVYDFAFGKAKVGIVKTK